MSEETYADKLERVRGWTIPNHGMGADEAAFDALRAVVARLDKLEAGQPKPLGKLPDPKSEGGKVLREAAYALCVEDDIAGAMWDIVFIVAPGLRRDVTARQLHDAVNPERDP